LLGLAVGDALGAPYEGLTHADIFFQFGSPDSLVKNPSGDTLFYTDDTEMMIGVAETLADCGRIEDERLCRAFAENYHPERGYGQGARRVIEAMRKGNDHRTLAATLLPGGSFGNGAAMRVAPVGLLFADAPEELWEQARLSALPTHTHPLGIEGAQLLALAVAWALKATVFDRKAFYRELLARATTEEFRWHIEIAARLKPGDSLAGLGSTLLAHRSVVTAMACFATAPGDFERVMSRAIGLGDDTDTVAAMAGALVGAFAGVNAIPPELFAKLEDGRAKGTSHIAGLAACLHERVIQRRAR
jgi:poly(ADP-ribose) glycohydrolase ARH3